MSTQPIIKNKDIIIVGQQPWDVEIGSNCKNIAQEFSKYNRVLYVNSALDRITQFKRGNDERIKFRKEVISHRQNGLIKVDDNLWTYYPDTLLESINWLHQHGLFNFFNKINNRRFAKSIHKAISALSFKDYLLFNDSDIFKSFYLPELLKPLASMYYSRDYLLTVDYWKFHGALLEPALIAKSDVCTANSTYLTGYCKQHNPHSYYVGQGCDLEVFTNFDQTAALPADVAQLKRPVIGYVGALQSIRLDIDLLAYIARQKPEWTIVLVGPEDEAFKASALHQIENVKFLGAKPGTEVPAYVSSFDVCLNPQVLNQVTIGNYPRKIDEYLAMGKPVVATRTEGMSIFENHTYLAVTGDDYIRLIGQALEEDNIALQQERIAFANTHTWENSVKAIYEAFATVKPQLTSN
jgi:teichuronic acid biosynthesis glycosyltransferase TuaH